MSIREKVAPEREGHARIKKKKSRAKGNKVFSHAMALTRLRRT